MLSMLISVQEHIVQWHPTILSKLALIPQRTFNSYNKGDTEGAYKDGDFVIRFPGCDEPGRSCTGESEIFSKQWKTVFRER
jgi:mannan polymerase II complex MNN11 subunit